MSISVALLAAVWAATASARDIDTRAFTFVVEPDRIVLGDTPAAIVTLRAKKADGTPLDVADPRIAVSSGTVSEARREGPGAWTCTYTPPAPGPPQIAVLVAAIDAGASDAVGFTTLSLYGKGETVVRTEAGSEVRVRAGKDTFGPVKADANGVARVPIALRPGVKTATALSLDEANNTSEKFVDLRVPPFNRIALLRLDEGTVGDGTGLARLIAVAVDELGHATAAAKVEATTNVGTVEIARDLAPGVHELALRPAKTSADKATVTVAIEGAKESTASADVPLAAGRAAAARITLSRDVLSETDADRVVTGTFQLVDAGGKPVPPQGAGVFVDIGRIAAIERDPDGRRHVTWVIPKDTGLEKATLTVHLPTGEELGKGEVALSRPKRREIVVPPTPPTPRPWLLAGAGVGLATNYGSIAAVAVEASAYWRVPNLLTPIYIGIAPGLQQQVWTAPGLDHRAFTLLFDAMWRPRLFDDRADFVLGVGAGPVVSGLVPRGGGDHVLSFSLATQLTLGLGIDLGPGVLDATLRAGTGYELAGHNTEILDGPPLGATVGVSYRFGLW